MLSNIFLFTKTISSVFQHVWSLNCLKSTDYYGSWHSGIFCKEVTSTTGRPLISRVTYTECYNIITCWVTESISTVQHTARTTLMTWKMKNSASNYNDNNDYLYQTTVRRMTVMVMLMFWSTSTITATTTNKYGNTLNHICYGTLYSTQSQ